MTENKLFNRMDLFDLILDHQNESDYVLLRDLEKFTSSVTPIDHYGGDVGKCCKVENYEEILHYINSGLSNTVSLEVELIEDKFSKRELAVTCAVLKFLLIYKK